MDEGGGAYTDLEGVRDRVNKVIARVGKELVCKLCGKVYHNRGNLAFHIESNHMTLELKCDSCEATFRTREARSKHIKKCNGEYSPQKKRGRRTKAKKQSNDEEDADDPDYQ